MSEQITILETMGEDCAAALLNHPHMTVLDATVYRISARRCEAVLYFDDGATLTGQFQLPDDAPAQLINTIRELLYEQSKRIEQAVLAGRELHDRVIH